MKHLTIILFLILSLAMVVVCLSWLTPYYDGAFISETLKVQQNNMDTQTINTSGYESSLVEEQPAIKGTINERIAEIDTILYVPPEGRSGGAWEEPLIQERKTLILIQDTLAEAKYNEELIKGTAE